MTFLAPVGLAALTLLAIPIIIHLFKPRRMQAIPFSSLRWLNQSTHSSVANSTASNERQGPHLWITSAL